MTPYHRPRNGCGRRRLQTRQQDHNATILRQIPPSVPPIHPHFSPPQMLESWAMVQSFSIKMTKFLEVQAMYQAVSQAPRLEHLFQQYAPKRDAIKDRMKTELKLHEKKNSRHETDENWRRNSPEEFEKFQKDNEGKIETLTWMLRFCAPNGPDGGKDDPLWNWKSFWQYYDKVRLAVNSSKLNLLELCKGFEEFVNMFNKKLSTGVANASITEILKIQEYCVKECETMTSILKSLDNDMKWYWKSRYARNTFDEIAWKIKSKDIHRIKQEKTAAYKRGKLIKESGGAAASTALLEAARSSGSEVLRLKCKFEVEDSIRPFHRLSGYLQNISMADAPALDRTQDVIMRAAEPDMNEVVMTGMSTELPETVAMERLVSYNPPFIVGTTVRNLRTPRVPMSTAKAQAERAANDRKDKMAALRAKIKKDKRARKAVEAKMKEPEVEKAAVVKAEELEANTAMAETTQESSVHTSTAIGDLKSGTSLTSPQGGKLKHDSDHEQGPLPKKHCRQNMSPVRSPVCVDEQTETPESIPNSSPVPKAVPLDMMDEMPTPTYNALTIDLETLLRPNSSILQPEPTSDALRRRRTRNDSEDDDQDLNGPEVKRARTTSHRVQRSPPSAVSNFSVFPPRAGSPTSVPMSASNDATSIARRRRRAKLEEEKKKLEAKIAARAARQARSEPPPQSPADPSVPFTMIPASVIISAKVTTPAPLASTPVTTEPLGSSDTQEIAVPVNTQDEINPTSAQEATVSANGQEEGIPANAQEALSPATNASSSVVESIAVPEASGIQEAEIDPVEACVEGSAASPASSVIFAMSSETAGPSSTTATSADPDDSVTSLDTDVSISSPEPDASVTSADPDSSATSAGSDDSATSVGSDGSVTSAEPDASVTKPSSLPAPTISLSAHSPVICSSLACPSIIWTFEGLVDYELDDMNCGCCC